MGNRKALLPLSMCISAVSEVTGMLTYVFIWLIVKGFFDTHGNGIPADTIRRVGGRSGCRKCRLILLGIDVLPSGGVPGGIQLAERSHETNRPHAPRILRPQYQRQDS